MTGGLDLKACIACFEATDKFGVPGFRHVLFQGVRVARHGSSCYFELLLVINLSQPRISCACLKPCADVHFDLRWKQICIKPWICDNWVLFRLVDENDRPEADGSVVFADSHVVSYHEVPQSTGLLNRVLLGVRRLKLYPIAWMLHLCNLRAGAITSLPEVSFSVLGDVSTGMLKYCHVLLSTVPEGKHTTIWSIVLRRCSSG